MRFDFEALQRPRAAILNLQRHGWQWNDPAQPRYIALVLKSSQVVFDPVVPRDQRGSARKHHFAIRGDQSTTGKDRLRLQKKQREWKYKDSKSFTHRGFLLMNFFGMFTAITLSVSEKFHQFAKSDYGTISLSVAKSRRDTCQSNNISCGSLCPSLPASMSSTLPSMGCASRPPLRGNSSSKCARHWPP